jgi:hypothetical protein
MHVAGTVQSGHRGPAGAVARLGSFWNARLRRAHGRRWGRACRPAPHVRRCASVLTTETRRYERERAGMSAHGRTEQSSDLPLCMTSAHGRSCCACVPCPFDLLRPQVLLSGDVHRKTPQCYVLKMRCNISLLRPAIVPPECNACF